MDDSKPQNLGGDQSAERDLRSADPKLSRAIELNDLIERRNAAAAQRIDQVERRISAVQGQLDAGGEPDREQQPDVARSVPKDRATGQRTRKTTDLDFGL